MKKYAPVKMIAQSRFSRFYETWDNKEKTKLIAKINQLIEEKSEYADSGNYGHLCNLLTSLAMVMVLKVDDILYSELPRADFLYTEQIGTGGRMCDYSFKKR